MEALHTARVPTEFGEKYIKVFCCDVSRFDERIDILTTSAFKKSYVPTPRTVFYALDNIGISVQKLSEDPFIDLGKSCNTWLSQEITKPKTFIRRIGCVEFINKTISPDAYAYENSTFRIGPFEFIKNTVKPDPYAFEQAIINAIRAYFKMLDIAAIYGVEMETIALPLLGSGNQNIESNLIFIPLLNECISFLKRNSEVKQIYFTEINREKANLIADFIRQSHSLSILSAAPAQTTAKCKAKAFISYSSKDKNIADNLCFKLESKGVAVWYAPRDVKGPYAEAIYKAIEQSTHFVVILSQNSMASQHVLNEIDLAFQALPNNIKFKPLRVDASMFNPAFKYYLSRQHWMDATVPPLEERLNDFVENFVADL